MFKNKFFLIRIILISLITISLISYVSAIGPGNPPVFNSITGGGIETPENSLVLQMTFDEYNSTHFFDRSRFGNNGTMVGGVNRTYGKNGWGARFDGVDDYVNTADIDLLSNFTISAWFNVLNANDYRAIVSKESASSDWNYRMFVELTTGKLVVDIRDQSANTPSISTSGSVVGGWHLGVFVRDTVTDRIYLYLDGIMVGNASDTTVGNEDTNQLTRIGASMTGASNPDHPFLGKIDDVRIYNRSFSSLEVFGLYSKQKSSFSNIADTDDLVVGLESFSDSDDNTTFTQIDWYKNGVLNATTGAPNDTGLVLFMTFDEKNKSYDYSRFKNNGTQVNGVGFSNDSALGLGSFIFDGVDDYVDSGKALSNFINISDGTMSAWIKPTGASPSVAAYYHGQGVIMDYTSGSGGFVGIGRGIIGGNDRIWVGNWDGNGDTIGIIYANDQWMHVVWVHANGTLYAYANGVQSGSTGSGNTISLGATVGVGRGYHATPGSEKYFNGSIDEVRIYNRSLSAEEINQLYRATAKKGFILNNSYTSESDVWRADVTLWDLYNRSETKSTYYFIKPYSDMFCHFVGSSTCPSGTTKLIGARNDSYGYNNAHSENRTNTLYNASLCCASTNSSVTIGFACNQATVIRLNQTTDSHIEIGSSSAYSNLACLNSTYKRVACTYPTPFCSSSSCVLSMASSEGANTTNAHVGDCGEYDQKVCCSLANSPPSKPVLTLPVNGNLTVFERYVNFTWTASTDPEGDAITYNLNVSCAGSCSCSSIYQTGISGVNYTPSSVLCRDVNYNWTVAACDVYGECNISAQSNFTILSVLHLDLFVNATSFGSMTQLQNNDTSDNTPSPVVGRNLGNVWINATTNATTLFSSVGLNTVNYMFKANNNESSSIVSACSQLTYTAFTNAHKNLFCNLSFIDTSDEVRLDINITVPESEQSGFKESIILIESSAVAE